MSALLTARFHPLGRLMLLALRLALWLALTPPLG